MMNKSTILGYAIGLLIPAMVMYGTGYNGTADALILTTVWVLLTVSILVLVLVILAGIAMAAIGLGDEIPDDVKTRMEAAKTNLNRWWVTVIMAGWMLVALASVGWTATAITYFIIGILSQIILRLYVSTYNSLVEKLTVSTAV